MSSSSSIRGIGVRGLRFFSSHREQTARKLVVERLENRWLLSASQAPLQGDYDFNNQVDQLDLEVFQSQYGATGVDLAADGNRDGVIDAVDYAVWRSQLGSSRANTPPEANDDDISINHAETAVVLPSQILANDCDFDGGAVEIISVANPTGGMVEFLDGLVYFTPHVGHNDEHGGIRAFDYTIRDINGAEATATATLTELPPIHGPGDEQRGAEHAALFTLIDSADATSVAVQDGAWSDPETWHNGAVPTAGDRVLIHNSVEVTYDTVSDAPLEWIRVDGMLTFQPDASTRVVVETFVSDPRGTINIGTAEQAIDAGVSAEILIDTTGGPLSQVEDPTLVGRGFVSHGRTNIHGSARQEFTTLDGDAAAGDEFIELSESQLPQGWQVGDTLLLVGTEVNDALLNSPNVAAQIMAADADNSRFGDELLEITSMAVVDGRVRVFFNNVTNESAINQSRTTLLWNHRRPDGETFDADELSIHVANLTRNVVVRSSDATVDIQQRGHFMVMHNRNAEIHHAQFKDLGRTNKRLVVDDPAAIGNFDGSPGGGTNPRGRYGLHLHRMGANSLDGAAAIVTGNVVWGTPGWGIVHHDSHAVLEDNIVFDVVGAGIVAEDGNELGIWRNNLVVKTTGDLVNNFDDGAFFQTPRGPQFDLGFFGSGYWVQGGGFGIRMEDNIAASTNGPGFDIVHNTDGLANVELISVELIADPVVRQAFLDAGFTQVTPNNIPTRGIDGLTAYNGFRGIHTWLHNRDSGDMEGSFTFPTFLSHDFRSTIEDFTIWNVQSGVQNFYSTRFDYVNGLIVGDVQNPVDYFASNEQQANNSTGVGVSHNHEEANNITFDGLRLEGFEYGFQVFSPFNNQQQGVSPYATSQLLNASLANVEHAFIPTNGSNPSSQAHRFSDLFVLDEASQFSTLGSAMNNGPTAAFGFSAGEGLSVILDAAASFDSDPSAEVRIGDDGIAAYAWDLDNDGDYDDAYGRVLTLNYNAVGDYPIGLKVWDDDGATATTNQSISVIESAYSNPWVDGDFSDTGSFAGQHYNIWSGRRGIGWIARDVERAPSGYAEIGTPQYGLGGFAQLVRDQHVRRGEQAFSFDLMNANVAGPNNVLRVRVFGVNGQWDLDNGAPSPIHAMNAPEVATLVDVNQGTANFADWQTQTYSVDLGAAGFEYLVINVEYFGYDYSQGDYFAFDNFSLLAPPSTAVSTATAGAATLSTQGEPRIPPRLLRRVAGVTDANSHDHQLEILTSTTLLEWRGQETAGRLNRPLTREPLSRLDRPASDQLADSVFADWEGLAGLD